VPDKTSRGVSNLPVVIPDVPDAPTVSASNVGTSRAFNNGAATVTIASPTGGLPASYSITTTPATVTTTTSTSPVTLTGLTSATSYTVSATATNVSATGPGGTSSSITATTVPQAPTIGTFTDGGTGTTGTLSFTAGATGGSSITNYKYSTDSSTYTALSPAQTSSPLSITGLTAGTYNFSVKAVNANGDSAASSTVSGTVITPSSYESIATVTVSGGATSSFTFSSIPSTYTSLQLRGIVRTGANNETVWMRLNGDTGSNYSAHALKGNSDSTVGTDANANANKINPIAWTIGTTGIWGASIIDIHDYTSTTRNKTVRAFFGADNNEATGAGKIYLASGSLRSTSAINSVTIAADSVFTAGTTFALYGIKGA